MFTIEYLEFGERAANQIRMACLKGGYFREGDKLG
jgi:hypothetical protein